MEKICTYEQTTPSSADAPNILPSKRETEQQSDTVIFILSNYYTLLFPKHLLPWIFNAERIYGRRLLDVRIISKHCGRL